MDVEQVASRDRQKDPAVAHTINLSSAHNSKLVCASQSVRRCVYIAGRCVLFTSGWVGVASQKPEGFGTCARTHSIGVSLHSFYLTPPRFSFFAVVGLIFVLATSVCTLNFIFAAFFPLPVFFFTPTRNTEKVGGAGLRSVPHSLACALSLAHSLFHSVIAISAEERLFFSRPH